MNLEGIDNRLSVIDGRLTLLTWMVGAHVGLALLILGSAFPIWSKLADIARLIPVH